MASAGWDEVLGGGDGSGGAPPDGPDGPGGPEDEDEVPPKKRIKTSTKIVLVVAGWLLLTLFLIGRFSANNGSPTAVANLDTAASGAAAGEPEVVDTEEEAALDANGDGFLSAEEQGLDTASASEESSGGSGASSAEAQAYEASPSGATGSSGGSGSGSGSGGGASSPTTPGAAPGGSTPTTTAAGGGGGGGGTTSTTKPGSTTSTTKGNTTTSSTTATTAAPTTTTTAANVPSTETSLYKGATTGFVKDDVTVRLSNGEASVTVTNDTSSDHFFALDTGAPAKIKDGESKTYTFTAAGNHTVTQPASGKTLTIHVLA